MLVVSQKEPHQVQHIWEIINSLGSNTVYSEEVINAHFGKGTGDLWMMINVLKKGGLQLTLADYVNQMAKETSTYAKYLFIASSLNIYNSRTHKYVKEQKSDKDPEVVRKVSYHYGCSMDVSKKYIDLLTKEELESVLQPYVNISIDEKGTITNKSVLSTRKVKKKSTKKVAKKGIL